MSLSILAKDQIRSFDESSVKYFKIESNTGDPLYGQVYNFTSANAISREYHQNPSVLQTLYREIELIDHLYIFRNPVEIKRFIVRNDILINTLFKALEHIEKIFMNINNMSLELESDPEENFEKLFILITSNITPNESLDLINKLNETWWLSLDINIRSILEIDVELI